MRQIIDAIWGKTGAIRKKTGVIRRITGVIIRELLPADEEAMFAMDSDPEVHRYLGNKPHQNIEETRRYIAGILQQYAENGIGRWVVVLKESGEVIGWTGFKRMRQMVNGHVNHLDFGYRFRRTYWGNGYAYESASGALNYGVDALGFKDIYGMTDVDNHASRHLLEKLGFQLVEIFAYDEPNMWHGHYGLPTTWYKFEQKRDGANAYSRHSHASG